MVARGGERGEAEPEGHSVLRSPKGAQGPGYKTRYEWTHQHLELLGTWGV